MDGWEICRSIRHLSDVPVMIVTAVCQDQAVVNGLECGADDYITKPFNPTILLARVRATLRRAALPPTRVRPTIYSDGYLTVDLDRRRVLADNKHVKLSAAEYHLLAYLFKHADRVLTSQQILRYVWGDEFRNHTEYVRVYISRLRQKLEKDPQAPRYLYNEPGFGYRFEKQLST
jgi:two-component system KDP operon response regulator KdpE